jgi:murein DD-endopeptidase MepM/ murein hydrolase activator NlpD
MKAAALILLGFLLLKGNIHSQVTYPNNEESQFEDMLTPEYYHSGNGSVFRNEINEYIYFARIESFLHPLKDSNGDASQYTVKRDFGDGLGLNAIVQYHPAIDMHVGNRETLVNLYAAYDGYVRTYRDAAKYRHYLSLSKDIKDTSGKILGKIVTLYAHIDLDLDSEENLLLDGKSVKQGDIVSKHLYAGTLGGPHLHFEIRYYRATDNGDEEFYGWSGGSASYTDASAGKWLYGYWNPNIGYGFANPDNYLSETSVNIITNNLQSEIEVYPNPANESVTINLNIVCQFINLSVYNLNGQLLDQKEVISKSSIKVDFDNYKAGTYIIKLLENENNLPTVFKVIKQ